jgi:hypothetical protein
MYELNKYQPTIPWCSGLHPYFFSESLVTETDGSRILPLVPIVASPYLTDVHEPATGAHRVIARSHGHELCHWSSIVERETHRRSRTMLLVPLVEVQENCHWSLSWQSMICLAVTNSATDPYPGKAWSVWQSRTVPLVPILAKHNPSGSHELWHWSLSWKIIICLAVTKSATGP